MAQAIELRSIEDVVKESELSDVNAERRQFEYKLNDKNAKSKLLKGAKREPFEVVKKTASLSLVFNLGSWSHVVQPSVVYWKTSLGDKSCTIGQTTVRVVSVKTGTEAGGKHIDTQIVFFINREKAVCHFYNTTQLILVNGHGYTKLVEEFLVPYFESKIGMNKDQIKRYNEQALDTLGSKRVKRGSVRYKGGSTFSCNRCDYAAGTLAALGKHSRTEHALGISSNSPSTSLSLPLHSTRNNSFAEAQLQENMSITNLSGVVGLAYDAKKETLKYTCLDCDYKTRTKSHMDRHVNSKHSPDAKDINFVCGTCNHEFVEKEDYNIHVKTHDQPLEETPAKSNSVEIEDLLDDSGSDDGKKIPTLDEVVRNISPCESQDDLSQFKCKDCAFSFTGFLDLNSHIESHHRKKDIVTNDDPDKCRKCNKVIRTNMGFARHVDLYCEVCKECLPERVSFDIHMGVKHKKLELPCDRCNKTFESQSTFKNHPCNPSPEFQCDKCSNTYKTNLELDSHQETKHEVSPDINQNRLVLFLCEKCDETFEEQGKYKNHRCNPIQCRKCLNTFNTELQLEWHEETEHEMNPETIKCDACTYVGASQEDLELHKVNNHTYPCYICKGVFACEASLNLHIQMHKSENVTCDKCKESFQNQASFEKHGCFHKQTEPTSCDQCDFKSLDLKDFISHLLREHKRYTPGIIPCGFCGFECSDKKLLDEHMIEYHEILVVLNGLARNQQYVGESFDKFKDEMSQKMKSVIEDNNIIKQELFILRQNSKNQAQQNSESNASGPSSPTLSSSTSKSAPALPPKSKSPEPRSYSSTAKSSLGDKKTNSNQPKQVLLIGDSISGNINLDVVEKALNGNVRACKAYAATYDDVGSEVKDPARFPAKNFRDVVQSEVQKEPIDYLLLQAGAVDITNLKTKHKPVEHSEYFKEETRNAAKNLFLSAVAALKLQPAIQKVIIMTQTPRYDSQAVDPRALKSALAQLYNNTLGELWLDSPYKNKVVIGIHNLECIGGIREARYRDIRSGRFDGVHLYGPSGMKAYTISVLNILKEADILDQTQIFTSQEFYCKEAKFQFQRRKNNRSNQKTNMRSDSNTDRDVRQKSSKTFKNGNTKRYTVPTSNQFDCLNW